MNWYENAFLSDCKHEAFGLASFRTYIEEIKDWVISDCPKNHIFMPSLCKCVSEGSYTWCNIANFDQSYNIKTLLNVYNERTLIDKITPLSHKKEHWIYCWILQRVVRLQYRSLITWLVRQWPVHRTQYPQNPCPWSQLQVCTCFMAVLIFPFIILTLISFCGTV